MKNEQTAVIKDMEFLLNELHKEWERPGEVKSSVSIPYEKVEEISRKLNVIVYETQQSADSDGLAFKQSIAKSKQCYVLLRIMRKIVKGKVIEVGATTDTAKSLQAQQMMTDEAAPKYQALDDALQKLMALNISLGNAKRAQLRTVMIAALTIRF